MGPKLEPSTSTSKPPPDKGEASPKSKEAKVSSALPKTSPPAVSENDNPAIQEGDESKKSKSPKKQSKPKKEKIKKELKSNSTSSSIILAHTKRKASKSADLKLPRQTNRQSGVDGESPAPVGSSAGNIEASTAPTLTVKDIIVIVVLWSHDIIHVLTEGWTASFLLEHSRVDVMAQFTEKIKFLVPKRVGQIVIIVLSLMAMIAIPAVTSGKSKLGFLLVGLMVYLATPIIGIMASNLGFVGLVDTMLVLEVGWNSVKPLRYWMIFHQKFPLPVIQSRMLVSVNQFMVELTEYIMTVWVTWETFSHVVFNIVWVLLFLLMVAWVVMIWTLRRSFNSTDDNIDVIQKEYEGSPIFDSFLSRQKPQHRILILCLLFPSFAISFQKAAVSFVFISIKHNLTETALYRIDLILSLMCLPLTACLLIVSPVLWQEIRDLAVIGIAHLTNVLVCIFFLVLIFGMSPSKSPDIMPYSRQIVIPSDVVFAYFIFPDKEYEKMILVKDGEEQSLGAPHCREILARKGSTVSVGGKLPNGITVFKKKITLTYSAGYYLKKGKLVEIKNFRLCLNTKPPAGQKMIWALSGLEPCKARGPQRSQNGTRFMFRKGCHSVKMSLTFMDSAPSVILKVLLDLPHLGEGPRHKPIITPPGTERIIIEHIVDGLIQPSSVKVERDYYKHYSSIFFIATHTEGKGDLEYLTSREGPMTHFSHENGRYGPPAVWTPWQCQAYATALCASSVAITAASASYIHFIWIQCPAKHRILILAFFFSINYFASWIPSLFFKGLGRIEFLALLVSQSVGWIWHVCTSVAYYFELRKLPHANQKQGHYALF